VRINIDRIFRDALRAVLFCFYFIIKLGLKIKYKNQPKLII